MNEDENIEAYMLRVNKFINVINRLGEKIKDSIIVKKALRSLPFRFDSKFSAIEEDKDLNSFSMDEMHGSLIVYDMRLRKSKPKDR